jgi:hypothetical protein
VQTQHAAKALGVQLAIVLARPATLTGVRALAVVSRGVGIVGAAADRSASASRRWYISDKSETGDAQARWASAD